LILKNDLSGWGDRNEFEVCLSAPGGTIESACPTAPDVGSGAAKTRQRQPDGLAVRAVSARLARLELIAGLDKRCLKKRNAAQAEYHRSAASV
jgi:hypothetical protein